MAGEGVDSGLEAGGGGGVAIGVHKEGGEPDAVAAGECVQAELGDVLHLRVGIGAQAPGQGLDLAIHGLGSVLPCRSGLRPGKGGAGSGRAKEKPSTRSHPGHRYHGDGGVDRFGLEQMPVEPGAHRVQGLAQKAVRCLSVPPIREHEVD